jgi:hypothetical protein
MQHVRRLIGVGILLSLPAVSSFGAAELITNGGFEAGLTGWNVIDQVGGDGSFFASSDFFSPLSSNPTAGPASGSFYAVSDQSGPGAHALLQEFTVAAGSTVTLSFDMFVNDWSEIGPIVDPSGLDFTSGGTFAPNQHARVDILALGVSPFETGVGVLTTLYLGVDPFLPNAYTHYSFDVTSIVGGGGTFVLRFAEVDNQFFFNQGIDNVSVTAGTPEPATVVLLGVGLVGLALRRVFRAR